MGREKIAVGSTQTASRFPGAAAETLTGARTITRKELDRSQAFFFDPGGAGRNVDLPPVGECKGVWVWISNRADAAEVLTIRDSAGATICTPTQNEDAILVCNGAIWGAIAGARS